jgi:putative transcriptional regulator
MNSLEGHFLIAMPGMSDPNFSEAVTFLCKHNDDGALGIVVNRAADMRLGDIFAQLGLECRDRAVCDQAVLSGGPVQPDRGFVMHQSEASFESTVDPGYAGWDAGQLEAELAANAWLSAPANADIIFATPVADRWRAAAALLGIDIRNVSSYPGHA